MSVTDDADHLGQTGVGLRVLASGSAGNCSLLLFKRDGIRRVCLLDLGLSPRRTFRLMADLGLGPHSVDDALLTHLDSDHFHLGWLRAFPPHAALRLHRRHHRSLSALDFPAANVCPFDGPITIQPGAVVDPILASHDEHGVAAFRFDFDGFGPHPASMGFATDLGQITPEIVEHFGGVDVLAIESNYCPRMQIESDRPEFLKRRIMGGRGHLSNEQSLEAVRQIRPRDHVVLLHLSRQCNQPDLAASLHRGEPYGLTVTSQTQPTGWIRIAPGRAGSPPRPRVRRLAHQSLLFDHA